MSLIRKIINDKQSSFKSSNFNVMIEKESYTHTLINPKEKYILDKLLSNHLLSDLSEIAEQYLGPRIVWIHGEKLKKMGTKYKIILGYHDTLAKFSFSGKHKLEGITKIIDHLDNEYNKGNLGTEVYKNKEYKVSSIRYYRNGKLDKTNGPAVEDSDGTKGWYRKGKLHKDDAPAEIFEGTKIWYFNGKQHRTGGPAIESSYGSQSWYQHGNYHRIDGPTIEYPDGQRHWFQYGERHMIDGPAIEQSDGSKEWYQNNKLHRIGGPAIEINGYIKEWWLYGEKYSNEKEYNKALSLLMEESI